MRTNRPRVSSFSKLYPGYSGLFWVFFFALIIYTFSYLKQAALPGNNLVYPEGWWGWFDQGQYLREANAFLHHDLNPNNYFYPPLYPILGAAFIALGLNQHPFFFTDGIAYGIFASISFAIARRYFSVLWSAAIVLITIVFNKNVLDNFAIPWTSSVTCVAYAGSFAILAFQVNRDKKSGTLRQIVLSSTLMALLFGLVVLTRPVDAAVAPIFFLSLLYINSTSIQSGSFNWVAALQTSGILGSIFLLAIVALLVFNKWIFHAYFGGYFNSTVTENGYFPSELLPKLFTLLRDGYTVNLEQGSSVTTHFPWMLLSGLGMVYAFVRRDLLLCVISVVILAQLCLYAPYGDLLPNGMWRYHNIHYFKWMFPFLGILALYALKETFTISKITKKNRLVLYLLLITSIRYSTATTEIADVKEPGPATIALTMPKARTDFIDLSGLTGSFTSIYFGAHQLSVDGKPLVKVKDFRMLPAPWGVRIIFNQPIDAHKVVLKGDSSLEFSGHYLARRGTYYFSFGAPRIFLDK